jgi:hypothetical protein
MIVERILRVVLDCLSMTVASGYRKIATARLAGDQASAADLASIRRIANSLDSNELRQRVLVTRDATC